MKRPADALPFRRLRLSCAAALLASAAVAFAAPTTQAPAQPTASPLLAPIAPPAAPLPGVGRFDTLTGEAALAALADGHWLAACRMATAVLARQVPDVNAIGLFGVCAAVNDDRTSARAALARLTEIEKPPYFGPLVEAVLLLHEQAADKALAAVRTAQQARADHPLARYFEGEALYAAKQPAAAISAFNAVLKAWPQFAPAMTANARLLAGPKASKAELREAVALADRATRVEPTNVGYWRLLADLSRRSGDEGRASAIELQYLRTPRLPAVK
jgi:tetratricopeptide (TPR) repeat protein